ncbi:MAG: hypothetical protein ACI82F_003212 [Planctomycetota bacterium]|jgi:hypothetical protein
MRSKGRSRPGDSGRVGVSTRATVILIVASLGIGWGIRLFSEDSRLDAPSLEPPRIEVANSDVAVDGPPELLDTRAAIATGYLAAHAGAPLHF